VSADGAAAAVQQQQRQLYVLQCVSKLPDDNESDSGDSTSDHASTTAAVLSNSNAANGSVTYSAAASGVHSKPGVAECKAAADEDTADDGTPQQALGRLDYVLRLCRLEAIEGIAHTSISEVQTEEHPDCAAGGHAGSCFATHV
jgi:hypothetical protein